MMMMAGGGRRGGGLAHRDDHYERHEEEGEDQAGDPQSLHGYTTESFLVTRRTNLSIDMAALIDSSELYILMTPTGLYLCPP